MDISKIADWGWPLMIAGSGLVFSIFALIHNEKYILLGLVTFLYGAIAHFADKFYWNNFKRTNSNIRVYYMHAILMVGWVLIGLKLLAIV